MSDARLKKTILKNVIVLSFDEHVLANEQFFSPLLVTSVLQSYIKKNIPVLLVCAAYCDAKQILKTAGKDALNGRAREAFAAVRALCKLHIDVIKKNNKKHTQKYADQALVIAQIQEIQNKIEILLAGVAKLKELSEKTIRIFKEYSLLLSAHVIRYVISAELGDQIQAQVKMYKSIDEVNKNNIKSAVSVVVPRILKNVSGDAESIHYDNLLALCVQKINATHLNLWTAGKGVLTANNIDVPHAKPIKNLSYNIALELAYLGATILHPAALEKLMQTDVIITIYSTADFRADFSYNSIKLNTKYATQISPGVSKQMFYKTLTNKKHPQIILTDRNNFTICTIYSANMFEVYGYLEKIFAICTKYGVSIETLTTSEISLTMTFETRYMNTDFLAQLQLLGEVKYDHNYSIINILGKQYWENPAHIAHALQSLENTKLKDTKIIKIATMSLGRNASNLSLVLQTKDTADALRMLHQCLCEF